MTNDEKNWLAADYALGVMRGAEKVAFEKQLQSDPELARLLIQWQERLRLVQPQASAFCSTLSEAKLMRPWPRCLSGCVPLWMPSLRVV